MTKPDKRSFHLKRVTTLCLLSGTPFLSGSIYANSESTGSNLYTAVAVQQQTHTVSGTVYDSKTGETLIGANVMIKGSTDGASTDYDGNFTLEVPANAILVVSSIGFISQEVPASAQMKIYLKEDTKSLDEVVVVGYSVQKKESLTGALQTLKQGKITNITTPAVENMLNGKAPGVYVSPGSGQPGSSGKVIIRGKSTINGSTDPLWVVDGVIVGSGPGAVNPSDIESMTILKDAASTAIYGSQGANGVILVTTKHAKADEFVINASAKLGISSLDNGNIEVMNGAELYDYYKSFQDADQITFPRWNENLRNSNYDWWDVASKTGFAQDYNVSIAGGNEKIRSYFSVGVYDETGAVKGYDYTRYSFRYRNTYKPYKFLTINPMVSGSRRDIDDRQYSVNAMYTMLPWDAPYQEDGTPTPHRSSTWVNSNSTNYLYDLQWNKSASTTYEFMGNLDFDINFTDWLTFSSVNNYKYQSSATHTYTDPRSNSGIGVNGRLYEYQSTIVRRYTNQILRFNKVFGAHSVTALAAYEFNDYKGKAISATGTGFIPGFEILDVTAKPEKVGGSLNEWAVQSVFFKGNYMYAGKYMGEVSGRRDGASNFGDNAKYGNFFSVSGGWNINREEFFKATWVDLLKLRASYGSVGNRPGALYPQYDLYSVSNKYDEQTGALISQIGNKDLTWEKTYTLGIGVDFSVFDRLRITADYYNKRTSNLLYNVPISGITGVTGLYSNVGEVENNGFEIAVSGDIVKTRDWYFGLDFNLGLNRNKVQKLYEGKDEMVIGGGTGIAGGANRLLRPGLDADTWYMPQWAGVNPETGAAQWYKTVKNEDGSTRQELTEKYEEADNQICGAYTPKFFGGFSADARWKNIDVNAVFGYSVGGKIYNYFRQEIDSDGAYTDRNQMKLQDGWSRWEKPGDIATHPAAWYNNSTNSNKCSSRYLEKGDYLKLRSLSVGYNLELPQYYIQNLRVFFTGENLFTITKYSGIDPEITPSEDNGVIGEVNTSAYPVTRKFMFGVNLTF